MNPEEAGGRDLALSSTTPSTSNIRGIWPIGREWDRAAKSICSDGANFSTNLRKQSPSILLRVHTNVVFENNRAGN